ncbi:MAG TPA: S41 family peptidase, partial [Anaerolineales bacterium]|nr:S41 family peptidase [Anaerolineales bacterium]
FNDLTVIDQVGTALRTLTAEAPLDGLILDNRHNAGGANTVLEGVLSYFTQGLVGYFVNRWEERPLYIEAVDVNGSQHLPLVVLIGEDTASFGEVFAGILQDLERATLIGVPTMANVETLYVYDFVDGSSAWIAHDTFRPVNSNPDWETTGVIPDITVPSEWDQITQATDPAINAALSFFD